jgi:flagellar biosynthesis/type III secretory pathway protein FliH
MWAAYNMGVRDGEGNQTAAYEEGYDEGYDAGFEDGNHEDH